MKRSELYFTFILLPFDIAMTVLSFVVAFYWRSHLEFGGEFHSSLGSYLSLSLYLIPLLVLVYALNGLYYTKADKSFALEVYRILESNSAAFAIMVMVLFFSKNLEFSRIILLLTWAVGILFVILSRASLRSLQKMLLKYGIGVKRVVAIGANETSKFLSSEINKNPQFGYKFIGAIDTDKSGEIKVLGDMGGFKDILSSRNIDEVVLVDDRISKTNLIALMDYCADRHINFKFIPNIIAMLSTKLQYGVIGSMPVMEVKITPLEGWGRIIKRISDIIFALVCIIISSPLLVTIAIVQKCSSSGPILYSHSRVGRDGKTFLLYKFRSMYENAENKVNKFWTDSDANDVRITPFGKFLRKTNFDELPQLFNILIGDMSFVGPRPEQVRFVEKFSHEVPDYLKRHRVKCGLTGWAQVNGLKGDTSISERVKYDMFYIENWSVLFDIKILFKTAWLILYEIFKGKYEYRDNS